MGGIGPSRGLRGVVSALALWHAVALWVAPAPDSRFKQGLERAFSPYLSVLHLDHGWGFFAPDPHPGVRMQVVIVDAEAREHVIDFTGGLDRSLATYQRYTMLQDYLWIDAQPYTEHAARYWCRHRADLSPVSVAFQFEAHQTVTPEAYLAGHRTGDPELVLVDRREPVACAR